MQTTELVHETYMRMVDQTHINSHTRPEFFAIAANLIRQIVVNHAEAHRAAKRGGGKKMVLEETSALIQQPGIDVIALNQAINKLTELDPRQRRVVELRFFGGLTEAEIADLLDISGIRCGAMGALPRRCYTTSFSMEHSNDSR